MARTKKPLTFEERLNSTEAKAEASVAVFKAARDDLFSSANDLANLGQELQAEIDRLTALKASVNDAEVNRTEQAIAIDNLIVGN